VSDTLSLGFAAAHIQHQGEWHTCCACYELTFQGSLWGKKLLVQVTNSGTDLLENQFDLQIPGGGVGIFNGCQAQWNTGVDGWGDRYGGCRWREECYNLPPQLQAGCFWRFDWLGDNPLMTFKRYRCPAALTSKTGCVRQDDNNYPEHPHFVLKDGVNQVAPLDLMPNATQIILPRVIPTVATEVIKDSESSGTTASLTCFAPWHMHRCAIIGGCLLLGAAHKLFSSRKAPAVATACGSGCDIPCKVHPEPLQL